ncbi:hypothetical protein K3727_09385 [Rhodobacteraceae bacterium M382]|nr:hypothetical protein K3727_09385 [Rhodobacteraceae bacterium M382]
MSNKSAFRVAVIGGSWLGAETLCRLNALGCDVALIAEATDQKPQDTARALGLPMALKPNDLPLLAADFPWQPDLIVSAHSFRIVPAWFIEWAKCGAIGYHPSLLPNYKGRRAIRDALADGTRITGGTVYWMTDNIDAGPAVIVGGTRLRRPVQILPGESALSLWKRSLAPLGAEMITTAVRDISGL